MHSETLIVKLILNRLVMFSNVLCIFYAVLGISLNIIQLNVNGFSIWKLKTLPEFASMHTGTRALNRGQCDH